MEPNFNKKRCHRPRLIPVLLMRQDGLLYKTQKFKDPKYVGDPRIAVKIFNDKGADELILLDITASKEKRQPNFKFIEEIASEAFMPLAYGGGIKNFEDAKMIFSLGVEKIVLNSALIEDPELIKKISDYSGAQSIVASIDTKKNIIGKWQVYTYAGRKRTKYGPVQLAKLAEEMGAGEIIINAIDHDGMFCGYEEDLCREVSAAVSIPVIACGGARNIQDCADVIKNAGVSAASAGSIFVFQGPHRAVLIKFPNDGELNHLFS